MGLIIIVVVVVVVIGFVVLSASGTAEIGARKSGRAAESLDDVKSKASASTSSGKRELVPLSKSRSRRLATHYEVLGVSADATSDEIKRAYWRRARETHPDMNHNTEREEFQRVQEAFAALSDEQQRAAYDAILGHGDHGPLLDLIDRGQFDDAIAFAAQLEVGGAATLAVAEACFQTGRDQLGLDFLFAALMAAPDDPTMTARLAATYLGIGHCERAREMASSVKAHWARHPILPEVAGEAAFCLELFREAFDCLVFAADHQDTRVDLIFEIACVAIRARDRAGTRRQLQSLAPYAEAGDPGFRMRVGYLHVASIELALPSRDFDSARQSLAAARELGVPEVETASLLDELNGLEAAHRRGELPRNWDPSTSFLSDIQMSFHKSGIRASALEEALAVGKLRDETFRDVGKTALRMVHKGEWSDTEAADAFQRVSSLLHQAKQLDDQLTRVKNRNQPEGFLDKILDYADRAIEKVKIESKQSELRRKIEDQYKDVGERILGRDPVPRRWHYHHARVERLLREQQALRAQARRFA